LDVQAPYVRLLVVLAGVVLGVVAYDVQIDNLGAGTTSLKAAAGVAAAWSFLAMGVATWSRRPGNLLGPIMAATCFALLARQLRYSHDVLAFTVFFALGEIGYALVAHSALAYPWGHVRDKAERTFLKVTYATVLAFPIAILLFHDGVTRLRYFDRFPRESAISVTGDSGVTRFLQDAYAVIAYGCLAVVFIALVVRKLWLASPRTRRTLGPLLLATVVAALWAIYNSVVAFVSPVPDFVAHNVFWWQITALIALPFALFVGLIRSRLAHASIGDLVLRLEKVTPAGIRDELATALRDPTLEVLFWLPERSSFVDVHGLPVELPEDGPTRAVTMLEHQDEPLAAVVHDPILRDEPELMDIAAAAARLALENARLQAEVQAQLAKVKESRARIVAAGDEQRRKIERDLHDGAQQRLSALALELRRAQRHVDGKSDPEIQHLLGDAAEEVQVAANEIRDIARGIHPGILTQGGLAVALNALATRASVPVTVDARLQRVSSEIEITAYFVASEGLTNVAKHSSASRAWITATLEDGRFVIEVADDGVGGAETDGGTGLRGLADRVEAQGGRLRIISPAGEGTRIVGEIPCG
jgi:signal transduction histidine kinase